jgi:thymidylate synthase (FAD)
MEHLKGITFQVLDKGSIEIVDWMGGDEDIVKAARISTGASTKSPLEDERLIDYLMEHQHTSPFEMCEIKLKLSMPIFIARQWMRHRMASINEFSGRYSEMKDEFYIPDTFRKQSSVNHQGSEGSFDPESNSKFSKSIEAYSNDTFHLYQHFLDKGISREMSRIVLPLSTYTSFFWKIDLHNLLKFLKLRMDPTAQEEIRVYADKIWDIVKIWTPLTAKSFENHHLNSISFSGDEKQFLIKFLKQVPDYEKLIKESGMKKRWRDKFMELLSHHE